jgi:hypothetical protein
LNKIRIEVCSDEQDWYEELFCKYVIDPILEFSNYNPNYTRDQLKIDAPKLNLPVEFVDDRLFFYVNESEAFVNVRRSIQPDSLTKDWGSNYVANEKASSINELSDSFYRVSQPDLWTFIRSRPELFEEPLANEPSHEV